MLSPYGAWTVEYGNRVMELDVAQATIKTHVGRIFSKSALATASRPWCSLM